MGMTPQSLQNKLNRGSFSAEDLIKIANFTGASLAFEVNDNQKIMFESTDIRE